ncbi:MFS transporter [Roseateles paludis]|jgi:GPH family glycoside/pentoside/hexuronide:cation symporter|uniref:MFS transporter n=1 Tax=Roseateles paludis TaxID=3145238 RepID=A0ABV0G1H9_9BURK
MHTTSKVEPATQGFYKLSALTRIGFGAGDLAQNLIYQTVSTYLLFFYTNVFGISAGAAAFMFLVVRLVDVIWDPFVGAFVDKRNPRLGKYRSYLILGGIPLSGLAVLSFWNGFSGQLWYAYVTYVTLSLCYTLINVPYGALNASLTRDTDEITKLTSTRMFMANLGGLAVQFGVPATIQHFAPDNDWSKPASSPIWFAVMSVYAVVGFGLLVFCFTQTKERVVMDESTGHTVKYADLFTEFARNRPLRIVAFFFITAFAMMAVGNSASAYYMQYNLDRADALPVFNALGSIPAFIFMPMVPALKRALGKKGMFYLFLSVAMIGMGMLYVVSVVPALRSQLWLVYVAQFVKSTGVIVATGYMWALVPEVISYGEWQTGRRISGVVSALTGIFFKAGFALGGVIPGVVLSMTAFDPTKAQQSAAAQQGILWLVVVLPAILLALAMFIISKYELEDDKIEEINREIESRHRNAAPSAVATA